MVYVRMYVEWLICKTHFWHIGTRATENLTDEVLKVESNLFCNTLSQLSQSAFIHKLCNPHGMLTFKCEFEVPSHQ